MSSGGPRVAVLGAHGSTGRAAWTALAEAGVPVVLAARRPTRGVSAEGHEQLVVDASRGDDLRRLFDGADVVVNCVGPYTSMGDPVVEAAIEAGVHVVDLSGEQPWLLRVRERHHEAARRAGVRIIPGAGVEVGLADIAAGALAREHQRPPWRVRTTIAVRGLRPSVGSRRSVLAVATAATWEWRAGALVATPPARRWRRCALPDLPGQHWVVSMPGGEIVTGSWHLRAEEIEAWIAGPVIAAPLLRALGAALPRLAPAGPPRQALERLLQVAPPPNDAATSTFHLLVEVDTAAVAITGSDVYGLSGRLAAHMAVAAARAESAGCLAPGEVATLEDVRAWLPSVRVDRLR